MFFLVYLKDSGLWYGFFFDVGRGQGQDLDVIAGFIQATP